MLHWCFCGGIWTAATNMGEEGPVGVILMTCGKLSSTGLMDAHFSGSWELGNTLLQSLDPSTTTTIPASLPSHPIPSQTFLPFSPSFALIEYHTSASRLALKWSAPSGDMQFATLEEEEWLEMLPFSSSVSLSLYRCPVALREFDSSPPPCHPHFLVYVETIPFSPLNPLCVTIFFYLKHPLFRNHWSLETNFHAYFRSVCKHIDSYLLATNKWTTRE